ncbi:MAG: hypothetical protein ACR2LR_13770 [Hassallia sp.]
MPPVTQTAITLLQTPTNSLRNNTMTKYHYEIQIDLTTLELGADMTQRMLH